MNLRMERFLHFRQGTVGRLIVPDQFTLFTLERPWLENTRNVSCIPAGTYWLEWDVTGRVQNTCRLRGTEPRTQINIHAANRVRELQGCIALGMRWDMEDGKTPCLLESILAMDKFKSYAKPNQFTEGEIVRNPDGDPLAIEIVDFSTEWNHKSPIQAE